MRMVLTLGMVCLLACAGCMSVSISDPHRHVVDVHEKPWGVELAEHVSIERIPMTEKAVRGNIVTNMAGTQVAYTIEAQISRDKQVEYVCFQNVGGTNAWVLLGMPMPHRPFTDLMWVEDRYLVFDRWSHPHYGMHYVVDSKARKLLLAVPFPDQFFLDQQKRGM